MKKPTSPILAAETLTMLLDTSAGAVIVVNAAGEIVHASSAAETLFGYEAGELLGQAIETLVPQAARDSHRHFRERFGTTPHTRPLVSGLNLQGQRKDGSTFEAEIALTPVETGEGSLVASTVREIGAEDASDTYFRHLLEVAPDAMIIVDADGRIAIANDQAEKMFGYRRSDLIGRHVELLLPEAVRERHVGHRQDFNADPRVRPMGIDLELFAQRADGSRFPVEISLSPVNSANGPFVSSVIRDVSHRKQMELELVEARRAAERAHKANTAFLAAASHDLRQPVQALSLLNGALRRTVDEPLAREMIDNQQHSLDAMTNLLNSLLDISRLDSGAVRVDMEEFPVKRIFDRLAAESARQANQKGLAFVAVPDDSVIRSDASLLGEILQNLISNAIRYTDEGEVKLGCSRQGDRLRIDVLDTGIGIAEDEQEEIFREFHQLDSHKSSHEGFGLGLAIVKRLADLLDHELEVYSVPGEGSRFSLLVPCLDGTWRGPADEAAQRPEESCEGGRILLIEDDQKVAAAWSLLLRAEGYSISTARTADEAADAVMQLRQKPDLLISDFHLLDGSTGVAAVNRVREICGSELPAFIVSGDTSKVVDDAKSLGNSLLLSKPVDTDLLLEMARSSITTGHVAGT